MAGVEKTARTVFRGASRPTTASWQRDGDLMALGLFQQMARRVPAYKDFLSRHKVDPSRIKTPAALLSVPPMSKDTYLRQYAHAELVWDGNLKHPGTIHATSGSTGEPTFFQRELQFDLHRAHYVEQFLARNPVTISGPTLFVITFGMGIWSAGTGIYTATYLAVNMKQYPVSIISPGVNKAEVLRVLKNIAPHFEQVVIAGYPPFVKDVLDDAAQDGIDLARMRLRFIFTGESFTEPFRSYIGVRASVENLFVDTMNTYGTSELGPVGIETPYTIMLRRIGNSPVFHDLFGETTRTPTVVQYLPKFVHLTESDGELFFTGNSTIPLMRYQSGDSGGLLTPEQVDKACSAHGIDMHAEARSRGIERLLDSRPLAFVFERKNLAVTLYALLIYPEYIKSALLHPKHADLLTGKFAMRRMHDGEQNQYLEINVELRKGVRHRPAHERYVCQTIVESLMARSSEYAELRRSLGDKANPRIIFWPYEDPAYFAPGNKQAWVVRS